MISAKGKYFQYRSSSFVKIWRFVKTSFDESGFFKPDSDNMMKRQKLMNSFDESGFFKTDSKKKKHYFF